MPSPLFPNPSSLKLGPAIPFPRGWRVSICPIPPSRPVRPHHRFSSNALTKGPLHLFVFFCPLQPIGCGAVHFLQHAWGYCRWHASLAPYHTLSPPASASLPPSSVFPPPTPPSPLGERPLSPSLSPSAFQPGLQSPYHHDGMILCHPPPLPPPPPCVPPPLPPPLSPLCPFSLPFGFSAGLGVFLITFNSH